MPTVLRQGGLRFMIFVEDHPPPHIQAIGDGQAKVVITGSKGKPELVRAAHVVVPEARLAIRIVRENQAYFLRMWEESMDEQSDEEIQAIIDRGNAEEATQPRAKTVKYDRKHGRIIVELTNGCTFAFPARLAQGLENATEDQLAEVEILGRGYALHWETLDADFTVPGLLAGIFGTKSYMARLAGQTSTPAKAAAARANGAKGGRPRKSA